MAWVILASFVLKDPTIDTVLFKDDLYPMIRFNTHDVSAFCRGKNEAGLVFKRLQGIFGRSDNMIKLRGINVFPHGIGGVLLERPEFQGEFFCRVVRDQNGRDDMIVMAEVTTDISDALNNSFRQLLKSRIGVDIAIELYKPGKLSHLTEVDIRQKPKRMKDERSI
jgi:phenylacetate-CoA ligase